MRCRRTLCATAARPSQKPAESINLGSPHGMTPCGDRFRMIASPDSVRCAENGRRADEEAISARGLCNGAEAAELSGAVASDRKDQLVCRTGLKECQAIADDRITSPLAPLVTPRPDRSIQPRRMAAAVFMPTRAEEPLKTTRHIAKAGSAGRERIPRSLMGPDTELTESRSLTAGTARDTLAGSTTSQIGIAWEHCAETPLCVENSATSTRRIMSVYAAPSRKRGCAYSRFPVLSRSISVQPQAAQRRIPKVIRNE